MRDALNTYEQIDRYLNQQLSGKELSDFENKMKVDRSFLEEVNNHQLIHELVVDQGLLEVKKKLQVIDARHSAGLKTWQLYTGIMLLIVSASLFMIQSELKENETSIKLKKEIAQPMESKPFAQKGSKSSDKSQRLKENKPEQTDQSIAHTTPFTSEIVVDSVKEYPKQTTDDIPSMHTQTNVPDQDNTQQDKKPPTTVICHLENPLLQLSVFHTCAGASTGKIIISENSDIVGQSPFSFSLDNKTYYNAYVFNNLFSGTYTISIKDALGCIWQDEQEILVKEKDCNVYEHAFYPDNQEIWQFPLPSDNNRDGKIEIYNRGGALVYSSQIINGYPESWNGTADGQPLPMGNYSFILKIGQDVRQGNVTLLR